MKVSSPLLIVGLVVGVAISLRQGGLVAPGLLGTDGKSVDEIMTALTDLAWLLAAAVAMPAVAQNQEMEEVVVTARKRDESFQDVPVTINVFTEATIRSAGIEKPGDFIALVPNMTLVETQNAGNAHSRFQGPPSAPRRSRVITSSAVSSVGSMNQPSRESAPPPFTTCTPGACFAWAIHSRLKVW